MFLLKDRIVSQIFDKAMLSLNRYHSINKTPTIVALISLFVVIEKTPTHLQLGWFLVEKLGVLAKRVYSFG